MKNFIKYTVLIVFACGLFSCSNSDDNETRALYEEQTEYLDIQNTEGSEEDIKKTRNGTSGG